MTSFFLVWSVIAVFWLLGRLIGLTYDKIRERRRYLDPAERQKRVIQWLQETKLPKPSAPVNWPYFESLVAKNLQYDPFQELDLNALLHMGERAYGKDVKEEDYLFIFEKSDLDALYAHPELARRRAARQQAQDELHLARAAQNAQRRANGSPEALRLLAHQFERRWPLKERDPGPGQRDYDIDTGHEHIPRWPLWR